MDLRRLFSRRGRRRDDERPSPAEATAPAPRRDDEGDDLAARVAELSRSFGQMPPDEQRIAAVERLTELRAAGKVSEENFLKEKRRLSGGG